MCRPQPSSAKDDNDYGNDCGPVLLLAPESEEGRALALTASWEWGSNPPAYRVAARDRAPEHPRQVVHLVPCVATQFATLPESPAGVTVLLTAARDPASAGHVSGAGDAWRGEAQDPSDDRCSRHSAGLACLAYLPHGAPPCQRFDRSRRSDVKGTVG